MNIRSPQIYFLFKSSRLIYREFFLYCNLLNSAIMLTMLFSRLIILLIFLFIPNLIYSQVKKPQPIILHNADSLVGTVEEYGATRTYFGNVKLEQGDVKLSCDVARHYIDLNKVELRGNVIILQDDMTLTSSEINYNGNLQLAESDKGIVISDNRSVLIAPRGIYSVKSLIAEFMGDVTIEDDSATIYADRIVYNRRTKNSFAYGSVYIIGKFTNVVLTAETVEYYPSKKYTIAYGKPVLFDVDSIIKNSTITLDSPDEFDEIIKIDTVEIKFDTLSIACDTMESIRGDGTEKYYFKENVEIARGNVFAKSPFAFYDKMGDSIVLNRSPIIWFEETQLFSDSTVIYLSERKLKSIIAYGNAFAGSISDTMYNNRIDQLLGNKIQLFFSSDSLRLITSTGDAKSLYFLIDKDGPEGVSRSSADSISIEIEDNKPIFIKWHNKVDGEFFPERLIADKPEQYYLTDFRRENDKPIKKELLPRKSFN